MNCIGIASKGEEMGLKLLKNNIPFSLRTVLNTGLLKEMELYVREERQKLNLRHSERVNKRLPVEHEMKRESSQFQVSSPSSSVELHSPT